MKIEILHLIEGAKQAQGLTVIIDVFRAFSLECFLYGMGIKEIRPVETIEDAFLLRNQIKDAVLIGERNGAKCEGFDFGNSPSTISVQEVKGKTIIHTTSAGTQGIINAKNADEIITGSLVNAKAVATYIQRRRPGKVSLVCMGTGGVEKNIEDELCANYIDSILRGECLPELEEKIKDLRYRGGEHFFVAENQWVFPQEDFWMCTKHDVFPFVIQVVKDELGFVTKKIVIE